MFDSRNSFNKSPVGAVKEGTRIHFKITVPRYLSCNEAVLIIEKEDTRERFLRGMFWCGKDDKKDEEWWECHFTPQTTGIYFYYFEIKTSRGRMSLYRGVCKNEIGKVSNGKKWQQTVYSKDFKTPDWLSGGIMYQIFPDRFYRSDKGNTYLYPDRKLHSNFHDIPDWLPNSAGKITNSDYFGGNLKGITEKLPYLKDLGVTCIYLNPIFEAHSNHRYNTANYSIIDPLLGDEDDFTELTDECKKLGIKLILDGVFSHTGSDSIYFNREGRYGMGGAYNDKKSPYYSWYNFRKWPEDYECWWNFDTLPNTNETNPHYNNYINGEGGIVESWIKKGASGWRLDVADELPDEFLDTLYERVKKTDPEAIVLGEVWEDASNKMAYGTLRRYLLGDQMDTVMNYPFRDAILGFLDGDHASLCMETIESIVENYPPECTRLLMNHIGTHDTERAVTHLSGKYRDYFTRDEQSKFTLNSEERVIAHKKMKLATLMQFTLPGVPCIYYGDEVGLEGGRDPFNRAFYPWGNENQTLLEWYKELKDLRNSSELFKEGLFKNVYSHGDIISYERYSLDETGKIKEELFFAINRSGKDVKLPVDFTGTPETIMGENYSEIFTLPPYGFSVLKIK